MAQSEEEAVLLLRWSSPDCFPRFSRSLASPIPSRPRFLTGPQTAESAMATAVETGADRTRLD